MNCMDEKVCDFSKASPIPKGFENRQQTPAKELFFLQ
jgi:hypothetical protein